MHTYSLQGITLDRWVVLHGSTHQAGISMRLSDVQVPGLAGVLPAGPGVPSEAEVTLILAPRVAGPEKGDLDGLLADLLALHTAPNLVLSRTGGGRSVQAEVRLRSVAFNEDDYLCGRRAVATVHLAMPGVWWRDPSTIDVSLAAGAQSILPAGTPPVERVGSAPITDAVMRFALGASAPSITDVLTGTGVSVANNATATQYTYLDAGRLQAWVSTSASAWTAPASGRLDHLVSYPGPGPLSITPQLRLGSTGTQDQRWAARARVADVVASHAAVLRYRRSWW